MNVYKLVLNNFMSFKSLEYEFVKNKPVVVIGKNGAGKSTLIEAIVWILYGKLLRSSDKDDVLRESYDKDCIAGDILFCFPSCNYLSVF